MKKVWPIRVTAESHRPDGKRVNMDKEVEGFEDAIGGMLTALRSRKDRGYPFLGCEIIGTTPIGQVISRIYDPDTETLV